MLTLRSRHALLLFPLLAAPLLAAACGSSVAGTGGGTTTTGSTGTAAGGASAGCPADTPDNGSACPGVPDGTACHYPMDCCADTIATCNGGAWEVQEGACIGLPPKTPKSPCPFDPPTDGASCVASTSCDGPLTCTYGLCPGCMQPAILATCEGTWSVTVQCDVDAGACDAGDGG
jgi:hypothetical protein